MDVIEGLTDLLGADAVLTGESVRERAAGVWRDDAIRAKAIVRPRDTEEVSQVMGLCNAHCQAVVAHGGLTGLVEGAVTGPNEVVVSLERMNVIEEVDPVGRTMTVQAGVLLQVLQEVAEDHALIFPLDLGARGSCTIGGNIATNAGGNRVIRYGMTRDMVLGLEAVLADGTVVSSMNRMIKNNAGYDLKHLMIGTEGTLGIVTRAVLRLREKPVSQETAFVALGSFADVSRFLKIMDAELGGTLSAFEVMWNDFYRLVTTPPANQTPPLDQGHPYYVLVEALGGDVTHDRARLEQALARCHEEGLIKDAVIADSEAKRRAIWAMRDDVEQVFQFAPVHIFDVSIKIGSMEAYVAEVRRRLESSFGKFHCFTFGHIGDGNLHFAVSVGGKEGEHREGVERCVYEPLVEKEGSVTAELGIGLEKKRWLPLCRTREEIALMRRIKRALDPNGILNPGKIFDLEDA
ncbi:MAG: FAD-binding oxidoreductase [Gammaproteobacteria bacterium]